MNPTQQDPAYEYCLGSEALQKWGPKTADMEYFDTTGQPSWESVSEGNDYCRGDKYRRKRQTPVQDGDGWIECAEKYPTDADLPAWFVNKKSGLVTLVSGIGSFGAAEISTHWKSAKIPAPPKPKQKTQEEIDNEAIDGMVKAAEFTPPEHTPIFWFRAGAHAALAWERSRGKEDGK